MQSWVTSSARDGLPTIEKDQPENFGLVALQQDFESPIFLTLREQLPYVLVHTVS